MVIDRHATDRVAGARRGKVRGPDHPQDGHGWRRERRRDLAAFPAGLLTALLAIASCGLGDSSGGIVEVGRAPEQVEAPSDPILLADETRDCAEEEPELGCRSNPAPTGSVLELASPPLLVTYVESEVTIDPNPDYGSPLAVRFSATFEIENRDDEALSVPNFVHDSLVFDVDGRNRDLGWETPDGLSSRGYPIEGVWIEPGTTGQVKATYGLATRGWDIALPWGLGLVQPAGGAVALRAAPIDLGAASDSYASGEVGVVESASSDSPEAVVEAFHQAIADWDVEAMCAQLSSRAQVHFTGRLVAGDCLGVIRDVMSLDWPSKIQERHATAEVIEFWHEGDEVPEDASIIGKEPNEDGVYAVIRPSAGPYDYVLYDFARDEGGIKIDVYLPIRRI